jgi:HAMP domain-containing protein
MTTAMNRNSWARTLRMLLVAGVLVIALLAAMLGLIGATGPIDMWAHDAGERSAAPPPTLVGPARA